MRNIKQNGKNMMNLVEIQKRVLKMDPLMAAKIIENFNLEIARLEKIKSEADGKYKSAFAKVECYQCKEALETLKEVALLRKETGEKGKEAETLETIVRCHSRLNDPEAAYEAAAEALRIYQEIGDKEGTLRVEDAIKELCQKNNCGDEKADEIIEKVILEFWKDFHGGKKFRMRGYDLYGALNMCKSVLEVNDISLATVREVYLIKAYLHRLMRNNWAEAADMWQEAIKAGATPEVLVGAYACLGLKNMAQSDVELAMQVACEHHIKTLPENIQPYQLLIIGRLAELIAREEVMGLRDIEAENALKIKRKETATKIFARLMEAISKLEEKKKPENNEVFGIKEAKEEIAQQMERVKITL